MPNTPPMLSDVNVYLDGSRLTGEARGALSGVRVYQTRNGASAFEVVIADPRLKWADDATFTECKDVRIEIGVPGKMRQVFDGEVTAWRHELERNGPTVLVVRGLDRSHRLMRSHKTRTYASATPIDCARKIAQEAGLTAKCVAGQPAPVQIFRMQANESDFSFLRKLADLEGYLFYVDGSELHFERPALSSADDVEMSYGEDVKTFLPVASFRKATVDVEVGAWDDAGKAEIVGKAAVGDELWSVPGGKPGADLARFQATRPKLALVEPEARTKEHADTIAKAALTRRNLEFISAEVEVKGNPEIKPGAMVNIKNVGVYSGHYWVTEANHFWDSAGYSTIFYVARDKWADSSRAKDEHVGEQRLSAAPAREQAPGRHSFAVQVVDDETGEPVRDVRLEVTLPDGTTRLVATAVDGSAEIGAVAAGDSRVTSPLAAAELARTLTFAGSGPAAGGAAPGGPPPPGRCVIAEVEEHRVKTGETLAGIAADHGLSESDLAKFNWGVTTGAEIEARLRDVVGCTKKSKQGRYRFDDSDHPGIIYVPKPWTQKDLAADKRHTIRVRRIRRRLPDLKFLYEIDPHAPGAKNDTLTLESEDGSWRHEVAVSALSEAEPGWVELVFPEPPAETRFNLIQDPGDGQPPFYVFQGASYGDLRESLGEEEDEPDGTA